ncbi:MAG: sugar phosphate nucleotidyltransferase [Chloroflexota bacterium]
MDVVIFCGGKGSRMGDETIEKPKPMIEIGSKPIIWHIMMIYSKFGFNRFVLPLGYKGSMIEEWFNDCDESKKWEIVFVETGLNTEKGGRLKRVESHIISEKFHVTYGDGVSNINLNRLVDFHRSHSGEASMTVVRPPSRFGFVSLNGNLVDEFEEKPQMQTGYINGGFFIFERNIFNYLSDDESCDLEYDILDAMAKQKKLFAYKHQDFWQCMDNIREKEYLDELCEKENTPWLD